MLPVHLYGQMADMRAVERLATKHGLQMIEDACQAHGAARDGVRPGSRAGRGIQLLSGEEPGSLRRCRCASHRRRAHRGTRARAARARSTREVSPRTRGIHGPPRHHPGPRAPAQAAAPRALERATAEAAARFTRLRWTGSVTSGCRPSRRERAGLAPVRRSHREPGPSAGAPRGQRNRHWAPLPGALPPDGGVCLAWTQTGSFPVAEALAQQALSLPLYPGISEGQVERVVEVVEDYFRGG